MNGWSCLLSPHHARGLHLKGVLCLNMPGVFRW